MAKDVRKPPPVRGTGPKRRDTPKAPTVNKSVLLAGGAALVILVVIVGVVLATNRGSDGEAGGSTPQQALVAAGCTFKTYKDLGQGHVESYDAKVSYNSTPPTSGPHHVQPVIWGAYTEPVERVQEVHNLEHGGVVIHYGDKVDEATREKLKAFYDDSPNAILLAPLPALGNKISLSAWTRLATCQEYDEAALAAFRSAYRGNGPERFRIGDLVPGT